MVQMSPGIVGSQINTPFLLNSVLPKEIHETYKTQQNKNKSK